VRVQKKNVGWCCCRLAGMLSNVVELRLSYRILEGAIFRFSLVSNLASKHQTIAAYIVQSPLYKNYLGTSC
jgi:hypothetical protein